MFVNRPGIAWALPQSPTILNVPYNHGTATTLNLTAATYNRTGTDFDPISLSMTANPDTISDSGLSFSVGSFYQTDGTITGYLTGIPLSIGEDTDYSITVRAVDTNESSYNSERTLTIRMLQDPNYVSPAS